MIKKWTKFYSKKGKFYILPHGDFGKVIKLFKKESVHKVLDIGCGSGRHLVELASEGMSVVGIDFSPAAAHHAETWLKEKQLPGKVYVGDFKDELKTFRTDEFDAIIAVSSLQYLESMKDVENIFQHIHRIMKPSGVLFIELPSEKTLIMQPNVPQMFFNKEELESLLSEYFDLQEFYKNKDESWVIIANNQN